VGPTEHGRMPSPFLASSILAPIIITHLSFYKNIGKQARVVLGVKEAMNIKTAVGKVQVWVRRVAVAALLYQYPIRMCCDVYLVA
jgi:hypothetical protein